MSPNQSTELHQIVHTQSAVSQNWLHYWKQYSGFHMWGFWANVAIFLIPLIVLFLTLDRKKIFHIGFFGLNVHVWFGYIDNIGVGSGLWSYPYKLIPFLPTSWGLEASLVPVVYMLVYQWCVNRDKNSIVYLVISAAVLAFVLKPLMIAMHLFEMYQWINYGYLFVGYCVTAAVSLGFTRLFLTLHKRSIAD